MNKPLLTAAAVAALVCGPGIAQPLQAQQGPGPGAGMRPPAASIAPTTVAVIDIEQVFKKLDGFKTQMDGLQREVKVAEDKLNTERLSINKMMEKLRDGQLNPKSVEYRRLEADIAEKQANYQIKTKLQSRDLMERQAAQFYKAYQEVTEVVREYSEKRGITLVLRFDSAQVDPTDRESVFRELNKPVQYQQNIDITQIVTDEINRRYQASGNTADRRPGGYQPAPGGVRSFVPPGGGGPPAGQLR